METAKLVTILAALVSAPDMKLVTAGTFFVRNDRFECVTGRLKLIEARHVIHIRCE